MTLDSRTEAERRYDETALSRPRVDPWAPIIETILDAVQPAERADEPLTEDEETILNWIIEHSRKA